ncbi:MAG TPA: aldo/keto reductase [Candidatus Faecaligallichristensenella faecipullorum]|nr:aldo/keto reductase [Candidatus Faecaligallichristensenella faecipullorum]
MKTLNLCDGAMRASQIILGCMRISNMEDSAVETLVRTAMEQGINFFDHADIYGGGRSESVFARAIHMNPALREKMILQSKCGIRPGQYDFSKEHILSSVEGSLKRLNTEYLDVLLLHRPDTLMEPEEVGEAFERLHESGKVRYFGVSNQNPLTMQLLQSGLKQKLCFNQMQLSLTNSGMIDQGLYANMQVGRGIWRDGGVLEYCRLNRITLQAWSPMQYGFFEGVFLGNEKFPELNKKIDEIAVRYGVTGTAVAIAWIMRHPAGIQPILGTTNVKRLVESCRAADFTLTRTEWYELYQAAGENLP